MTLDIKPLDPHSAPEQHLADYFAMLTAVVAADTPEDQPPTFEGSIGRMRTPPIEHGPCRFWAAHLDGRLVGTARLALPDDTNTDIIHIEVYVHPDLRRQGIGTRLLSAAMPTALKSERSTVFGLPMKPGSAGAHWVDCLGFEITLSKVIQALPTTARLTHQWDLPVPAGYRLAQWTGATPEALIDSYVVARQAIQEAPVGRATYRDTDWTADRVREADRLLSNDGVEQRVVVAIDDNTDEVAGVHVIHINAYRREFGYVHDTCVLAVHRGHGLGLAMKGAMMRWLMDERPDLERIHTSTATENTQMIRINHALGYHTARTLNWVETPVTRLAENLAARI
jgi:mycothiol synthase